MDRNAELKGRGEQGEAKTMPADRKEPYQQPLLIRHEELPGITGVKAITVSPVQ